MSERIVIVEGIRTPYCRAGGVLKGCPADILGATAVRELLARSGCPLNAVQELVFGNVMQPPQLANIARIIAVEAGLPASTPAYTVNRNCASGIQAVASAAEAIAIGKIDLAVAGGCESMSNFAVLFKPEMRDFLQNLSKARGWYQRLRQLLRLRPSFLMPVIPGLEDPLCGLNMGQTAELLAREFQVTRAEQDEFAFNSQKRAAAAQKSGFFEGEIVPLPLPPVYKTFQHHDDGVRAGQTLAQLSELKPVFDRLNGTVTAGNSSQVTDGSAALLLASEKRAKELGLKPLGYVLGWTAVGLDPSRMGLGPVFATAKLCAEKGYNLSDFDLIEINEAFAAQVLACLKAFESDEFASRHLAQAAALGKIDRNKLNVNGGAIALGHPLGASGGRMILTLLRELRRRQKPLGLATLCVGGGQGMALALEAAL